MDSDTSQHRKCRNSDQFDLADLEGWTFGLSDNKGRYILPL